MLRTPCSSRSLLAALRAARDTSRSSPSYRLVADGSLAAGLQNAHAWWERVPPDSVQLTRGGWRYASEGAEAAAAKADAPRLPAVVALATLTKKPPVRQQRLCTHDPGSGLCLCWMSSEWMARRPARLLRRAHLSLAAPLAAPHAAPHAAPRAARRTARRRSARNVLTCFAPRCCQPASLRFNLLEMVLCYCYTCRLFCNAPHDDPAQVKPPEPRMRLCGARHAIGDCKLAISPPIPGPASTPGRRPRRSWLCRRRWAAN